jgi:hypothetical protein
MAASKSIDSVTASSANFSLENEARIDAEVMSHPTPHLTGPCDRRNEMR